MYIYICRLILAIWYFQKVIQFFFINSIPLLARPDIKHLKLKKIIKWRYNELFTNDINKKAKKYWVYFVIILVAIF